MIRMQTRPQPGDSSGCSTRLDGPIAPPRQPAPAAMTAERASGVPAKSRPWMLVGVDGSAESSAALRWAASQSGRFGEIVPATAWRYPPWALVRPTADQAVAWPESAFIRHAKHRASSVLRLAEISDCPEHLVEERAAGPMLVANSAEADLLVVGSRSSAKGVFASSVVEYCIAHSHVPVAVVPSSPRPFSHGRVVVGMDDSPEAHAALEWAIRHTHREHDVHVIHVTGAIAEPSLELDQIVERARSSVDPATSPRIIGRAMPGWPAETLALAASEADMLIVGARGRGRIGHAFLGSVTTSLCRSPAVVTIVVPS